MKLFLIYMVIFIIEIFFDVECSSNAKSKDKYDKKVKNYEHSKTGSYHRFACSEFHADYHPIVEKRTFMSNFILVKSDFVENSPHSTLVSSLSFHEKIYDLFLQQCSSDEAFSRFDNGLHELVWRYQFYEAQHCIRVELDFGNVTKFKELYDVNTYMFTFREFSKKNIHLKRQGIVDEINSLTIHRVNIRPYIVCVSFFKTIEDNENLSENSTESNSSSSNSDILSCPELGSLLKQEERIHDFDLCVDIDTQVHFLSGGDISHNKIDRELVMVIFIMCLLAVVLGTITLTHYIIEKPKKEALRKQITDFIRRHTKSSPSDRNQHSLINSASSLNNKGSRDSLKNASPNIVVTDYSAITSSNNRVNSPNFLDRLSESAEETDTLLDSADNANGNNVTQAKVSFHVGETIIEEDPLQIDSPVISDKSQQHQNSNSDDSNSNEMDENDKECIKTISHLLDDKPWMSSSAALTSPSLGTRQSFANILPTVSSSAKLLNNTNSST